MQPPIRSACTLLRAMGRQLGKTASTACDFNAGCAPAFILSHVCETLAGPSKRQSIEP